jgi:hypothetical protein
MQKFFFLLLSSCFLPLAVWACPWCRPRVQAGIYTPAYTANLGLVLLPIVVLLALGASVFYWDKLRTFFPFAHNAA